MSVINARHSPGRNAPTTRPVPRILEASGPALAGP